MKLINTSALAIALAATTISATPSPAQNEARATSASSGSLPAITQRGNAFWNGNERFYLRGIDYQPGGSSIVGSAADPLAHPSVCMRDIPYFQKLGLNVIRVYEVDNALNHDECMNALAAAGIYLVLDVNNPLYSLNRNDPAVSYNPTYLQSVFATIDAFAKYTNTLAFFSGNEVINMQNNTNSAPYVKAVTRDMKQYIGEQGLRDIPVGYSAADVTENQYLMAQYMNCGPSQTQGDFYAINNYEWCDALPGDVQPTFETSGWSILVDQYQNYSVPLFFSEYGCIKPTRNFAETKALYQTDMTGVFSGGLVYEYSQETNDFGVVNINGQKVTPVGSQFSDLQQELAAAQSPSGDGGYSANNPNQDCPAQGVNWDTKPFTGSSLPAMPEGAVKYLKSGAGKGPGLTGDGSQNAPGGSTVTASANAGQVTQTYGSGGSAATSSGAAVSTRMGGQMNLIPVVASGVVVAVSFVFGMAIF